MNHIPESDEITYVDNKKYCLGFCFLHSNKILLESRLNISTFFQIPYKDLLYFYMNNSYVEPNWDRFEILQFDFIKDNEHDWFYYNCIIKTYYIRIIQRVWKKIFIKRREMIKNPYKIYKFIQQRKIDGKSKFFPSDLKIRGMLSPTVNNNL